jgi:hypothetical protein
VLAPAPRPASHISGQIPDFSDLRQRVPFFPYLIFQEKIGIFEESGILLVSHPFWVQHPGKNDLFIRIPAGPVPEASMG